MKFPFWLLPIIAMTIIIVGMSETQKPWRELPPTERSRAIILIVSGIVFLTASVILLLLLN